jgi:hypothetical protein
MIHFQWPKPKSPTPSGFLAFPPRRIKQEQMVAEVEGRREAEKLVEKHLQNMKSSEKQITYHVSKLLTRDS